ncbi:MAG: microtubule associated protein-domain-containing protein [Benniella sp.]|nr:MAG: microtubule associated protein-domain-containing protein [Benniella sp.]
MSWNDFLPELAVKHEVLEALYADIGTPDDKKAEECQTLFHRFIGVINDHIDQVQQEKDRLGQECEQMLENIRRMATLAGQGEEGVVRLVDTLETLNLWGRHSLLREEYTYILEHYTQKLEEIRALHRELADYTNILGPTYVQAGPYPEEGAAVTFDVVQQFSDNIEACKKEQKRRRSLIESTVISIKHLCNELGSTEQDAIEKVIAESEQGHYPLTDEAIRRLEMTKKMLEDEFSKREVLVKDHLAAITRLWDKLRIEDDEREEFMTNHVGLSLDTIRAHKAELSRLEELRSEKLQDLIMDERNALYELWDKLYYSPEQQEKFTPLLDDDFTEENLALHEEEVARLKLEVEEHENILNAIEQYRKMLDDIREFEITSMDARRLFHRDPGRLLREEKFRKRVAREFPRVEKELEDALYEWQEIKGRPFLVYGEEYIKTMKLHAQEAREGKENEKLWRTPTSKRIGLPSGNRTPTSQHKRITPSVHPTTPTRNRTQAASGLNSILQSPQSFHSLQLQRSNSVGNKTYSRSESPATPFSLSKLLASPSSKQGTVRRSGPAAMLSSGESGSSRSHAVHDADPLMEPPRTPTRPSRFNRPVDLTRHSIREVEEEEEERTLQFSRPPKRTASELSSSSSDSPPGSPSIRKLHYRKKSRSPSPESAILTSAILDSPFVSKTADKLNQAMGAADGLEQDNRFMKKLLEVRSEQANDVVDGMEMAEDTAEDDSVIELDQLEAEKFFSTPKKVTEVVELQDDDDPLLARWTLTKDSRGPTSKATVPRIDTGDGEDWNSEEDARRVERIVLDASPSTKQTTNFEIKSSGS